MAERKANTKVLTEAALMTALAVLLGFIQIRGPWIAGGSVSLEMVPLILFSLRRGMKWGGAAGVIYGILDFLFHPFYMHPVQLLLDYPVPFGLLGLAGIFLVREKQSRGKKIILVFLATTIAVFARFLSHFVSGIVFYGSNAPEGQPVALYSFVYNIGYLAPSYIFVLIILILFMITAPRFVERQRR
ncbi:thiamine transporter [Scopulibacillus darangshiensis]|uniref:Thiamine transporter n=1 Tax=Scopulibacillus darangshiensis TaxID=442528 RepID=A0A4R2P5S7_9BACL|nr:energy-coupled thiamine transporter ThiT [Scopulibacillus darangshiensis]TCP29135.1 thiamine transporter [Scopulibacillus darangshiensis]